MELRLGLIGDNIARSKSPLLHRLAGGLTGVGVTYDRLIPVDLGQDFDAVFQGCVEGGYRGINVTYPYKERTATMVRIGDDLVRRIGAVNTVLFEAGGPRGFNTDYSGFRAAFRSVMGARDPGPVCMIGAGGVGKAIAYGLVAEGARELRIVERDLGKAAALAAGLRDAAPGVVVRVGDDAAVAAKGASGLVNCTPVGMVGHEGTPLLRGLMAGAVWAFDAVYTPVETRFLRDAGAEGLTLISGYELFFFQGVDAWEIFSGRPVDRAALRRALAEETTTPT